MARLEEWISTDELSKREGVSTKTILRYARLKLITFQRKGLGKTRGALMFPASVVHEQLARLRQTHGIAVPSVAATASPTAIELTQQLRDVNLRLERLSADVRTLLSRTTASA